MQDQKLAIVTGAGTGVGQACALALSKENYLVVLLGRRIQKLDETAAKISSVGGSAVAIAMDTTNPEEVTGIFEETASRHGRIDLLFNNAGVNTPATALEDLSYKDWQYVIDVNLTGSFLCTQAAFRLMKAQKPMGGRIINNGSVSAQAPRPDSIAYTATKHAMNGLTRSTALDGRQYNIACGQIDIGNTATKMTSRMESGVKQPNGNIEIEPTMDVTNVAAAVVYMANLPLNTNVLAMTVMATAMPLVGRG
ncbi:MAG: 3-oxoacyl-ACP reductase [Acidiferrobacteraceae bacterium]|nr:3-oxoacyl-ACP reductase [Acidiferrobacteraceae bacterium]